MAINVLPNLWEMIDKESPGDMSISPGQSEASLFFILDFDPFIYTYIKDILGSTEFNTRDWLIGETGGLSRSLPMSHPLIPNLYAQEIKIVGIGPDGKWNSEAIAWNATLFNTANANNVGYKTNPTTGKYTKARIEVVFRALNYMLYSDDQLEPLILQGNLLSPPSYNFYYKEVVNNAGTLEFQPQQSSYYDFREYLRYTSLSIEPSTEIIVKQNGSLYYKSTAGVDIVGARPNNQNVSNATGNAQFTTIVTNKIKIKWYQIPKDAMFNTNYNSYAGQINYGINFDQVVDPIQDIETFNWPMWNFQPGTLLYLGMTSEPVNNSFKINSPYRNLNAASLFDPILSNQYVNMTFEFLQRVIPNNLIVQPDTALMQPDRNGKMYTTGWNFVPFSNGLYKYVESYNQETETTQMCPYFSFPIQILFDPQNVSS